MLHPAIPKFLRLIISCVLNQIFEFEIAPLPVRESCPNYDSGAWFLTNCLQGQPFSTRANCPALFPKARLFYHQRSWQYCRPHKKQRQMLDPLQIPNPLFAQQRQLDSLQLPLLCEWLQSSEAHFFENHREYPFLQLARVPSIFRY